MTSAPTREADTDPSDPGTASPPLPSALTEADVRAARALLQAGRPREALARCDAGLARTPDDRDALYTAAAILRLIKRYPEALARLARALDAAPGWGRAHQERGHVLRDMGDAGGALAAYQEAVTHNNALPASWRMLADLHARFGEAEAAAYAEGQHAHYAGLPAELLGVASFIEEKAWRKAETLCRSYLQKHPEDVEGMRLLAQIAVQSGATDEAEFLLETAQILAPENLGVQYDLVEVLNKRQKIDRALEEAEKLRVRAAGSPQVEMVYANQQQAAGNFDAALAVYDALQAKAPDNPSIALTRGHALKTVGRQDEAIAAYRAAYAARPDFGDAFWSLANLKTYRFGEDELAQMREREAAPRTALADRYHLCFALGKALEDRGDYAEAFTYYERGNRLKRDEVGYDWRRIHGDIEAQIAHCGADLFAQHAGQGDPAPDPIFILGLPRAGSTLLEQILSSHSQVEGTMELPNVLALAHKLDGRRRPGEERRYPANLADLTAADLAKFGAAFIADTCIHRKQARPFFIDKMPNNFRHIGLIHLMLPNAKIIDARRGAMSCCFSGFKQLFAEGQEFTYGLEEIGHYYADYVRLMDHWDAVLPGRVLRVQYEDVVADLEMQVRRLLDFCGLPFEEACLAFHRNDRAVRTASSEQVRKPIYTDGVDQWRHFSPWLDPLRAVLGPGLSTT